MGKVEATPEPWFRRNPVALRNVESILRAKFPTLHAIIEDDVCMVRGTFDPVGNGCSDDRYGLAIALPTDYPQSLPTVWETEERIPRVIDRHIFPDNSLCLGVELQLWIELGGDFSIERVLDIPVRNFLIGNSLVEIGQDWPHGDRSHGVAGVVEYFGELINTTDDMTIARFLLDVALGKIKGHWLCPCGSGLIVRKCHREAIEKLQQVPQRYVMHACDMIVRRIDWRIRERPASE